MKRRAEALTEPDIEKEKQDNIKIAKSRKSVYIYVAVLFLIVLLFILLSYLMQQRNNSELYTLNEKNATAQQNIENLQTTNIQLQDENGVYEARIKELEAKISSLEEKVHDTERLWQSDVQNVKNSDAALYNELQEKYNELVNKYEVKGNNK